MGIRVTVLGDTAGNTLLTRIGCEVLSNVPPTKGDLVFVGVSADFGALRSTFEALKLASGHETGHLAIWLTEVELCQDRELLELTELETREWLVSIRVIPFRSDKLLPIFRSNEADLGAQIAEFARSEPKAIILGTPDDTPDW